MTYLNEKTHYYVSFEHSVLFRAFLSTNGLDSDQVSVIRNPCSSLRIPLKSTVYVLGKPDQDALFELDWARIGRECTIKVIDPFFKVANEPLFEAENTSTNDTTAHEEQLRG